MQLNFLVGLDVFKKVIHQDFKMDIKITFKLYYLKFFFSFPFGIHRQGFWALSVTLGSYNSQLNA